MFTHLLEDATLVKVTTLCGRADSRRYADAHELCTATFTILRRPSSRPVTAISRQWSRCCENSPARSPPSVSLQWSSVLPVRKLFFFIFTTATAQSSPSVGLGQDFSVFGGWVESTITKVGY